MNIVCCFVRLRGGSGLGGLEGTSFVSSARGRFVPRIGLFCCKGLSAFGIALCGNEVEVGFLDGELLTFEMTLCENEVDAGMPSSTAALSAWGVDRKAGPGSVVVERDFFLDSGSTDTGGEIVLSKYFESIYK